MNRIAVVSSAAASGKTTLAVALSARLSVPFIELDRLYWRENWSHPNLDEFLQQIVAATRGDRWVIDGNYTSSAARFLIRRTDAVVWLDLPLWVAAYRTLRRSLRRIQTGEELWNGNRESISNALLARDALIWYTLRTYRRRRRWFEIQLRPDNYDGTVFRFVSNADADRWLRSLGSRE